MRTAVVIALGAALAVACGFRSQVPTDRARDARFGYFAGDVRVLSKHNICSSWMTDVVSRDEHAITHISFPETNVQDACFVRVRHDGEDIATPIDSAPRGCVFPGVKTRARLLALQVELEAVAKDPTVASPLLDCSLSASDKRLAAAHNAKVVRAMLDDDAIYPYGAVVVPGHGLGAQSASRLVRFRPGDACLAIPESEHAALGGMMPRTRRALALVRGRVAPVAIVSGAAVHSVLNESFAMLHLMSCARADIAGPGQPPVTAERVLLEPCADHTHTNLRNAGRWIHAMGARTAYVITDDFLQAKYFQDESGFEFIGGSIDQRSIRDFGYVIGSWRQASVGLASGFWFTPYRFWAEPRDGLGTLTCVD